MRGRFEKMIRGIQSQVCAAIEEVDGNTFRQDAWTRPGGGGGITRVMQEGNVWEKAGVAVSVVYGTMPAEAYRVAVGKDIPFDRVSRGQGAGGLMLLGGVQGRAAHYPAATTLPCRWLPGWASDQHPPSPACSPALQDDRVPFFAAGISSVMHPWNPHCPTMHFNYR